MDVRLAMLGTVAILAALVFFLIGGTRVVRMARSEA